MAMAAMNTASVLLAQLNANKLLIGVSGLLVNLGSRFVLSDYMSPGQQRYMAGPAVKRVVVFCMCFVATRDLLLSVALSLAVIVLVEGLLHEESRFCVLPGVCNRNPVSALTRRAGERKALGALARPFLPQK
jgi:hypothetical protein